MNTRFTQKDFQVKLIKPELKVGLEVVFEGKGGKIISMEGTGRFFNRKDTLLIELNEPDERSVTIIEISKSMFYYLTQ